MQSHLQFLAGVTSVGENLAQPGEAVSDGFQEIGRAIAILDVSGKDEHE